MPMVPKRTDRINELIRTQLATIVAREIEFPKKTVIAFTKAAVSGDLKKATVHMSVFPDAQRDMCLRILQKQQSHIQYLLGRQLTMYSIPRLRFVLDRASPALEPEDEVDEIIRTLNKES